MVLLLTALLGGLVTLCAWLAGQRRRQLLATVESVTLPGVAATRLGNRRDVTVFLPPGYRRQPDRTYPVLYVNDGQEREALGLREALARLAAGGRMRPIIAVAIPTNDDRLHEYGTAIAPNSRSLGVLAGAYSHFVVAELMPLIEAQFRVQGPATFLGVSLGGLSAFDIAWNHPGCFEAVGVMSGSLWWHAAEGETRIDPGRRIAHTLVRRAHRPPALRFWFQAGTRDEVCDRDGNGVIDAIQDTLELMDELRAIGLHPNDLAYVEVEGGRHDYETWACVLPDFLMWAFTPGRDRRTERPSSGVHPPR